MRFTNLRRPALGAALLLALLLGGASHSPLASGTDGGTAIAGWDFRFGWGPPSRSGSRIGDRHDHDLCVTAYDEGWDKGAVAALRTAYRDGNRGLPYCDRPDSCEPGRSAEWVRGYHDGYAAAYRSAFEFGRDARRRGLGRRNG